MLFKQTFIIPALLIILIGGCVNFTEKKEPPGLHEVLSSLSAEECDVLETFFRTFLSESQGGYVLYGDKPSCLEGVAFREKGSIYMDGWAHRFTTKLKEGALLWAKLGLNRFCKNYYIHVYETPAWEWRRFLFVNKNAVAGVIQANISLFQYILGPKVTPEDLLAQFANPTGDFDLVINHDRVLTGILLGYGTQNSLLGSRKENIRETVSVPSFGFNSMHDEESWLDESSLLSIDMSEVKNPPLPWFGCYESQETKVLIDGYKSSQKRIAKVLKSDHFLEEVLSKLFDCKVRWNSKLIRNSRSQLPERGELTRIVAQSVWHCIDKDERDAEYIHSFRKGLHDSEQGKAALSEEEYGNLIGKYGLLLRTFSPKDADFLAHRKEVGYAAGLRVWNHFKIGKDLYSFSDVMKYIDDAESEAINFQEIDGQTDEVLTHLHALLYQQTDFANHKQGLKLVVSPDGKEGTLKIHQDARIYLGRFEKAEEVELPIMAGRSVWVQIVKGKARVNGSILMQGDGVSMSGEKSVVIKGDKAAEILLFDLR